ncbi:mll4316 [Mesorhizobium japonicum MAFF 303099]|uniref:Mll4316 protein n=1 Tax=Mesorhizobium japonicum (strain LMG 29417 / CECT 9101 / MAFF 303099) TaxID=266835 RepID=Q98EB8_RHILO|nr:mll4316 [Mesorhizobium japonicum MAFF 303099]
MRGALGLCCYACRSPKTEITFGRHALAGDLDIGAEWRRLGRILVMHEEVALVFPGRQSIERQVGLEEEFAVVRAGSDLHAADLLEGAQSFARVGKHGEVDGKRDLAVAEAVRAIAIADRFHIEHDLLAWLVDVIGTLAVDAEAAGRIDLFDILHGERHRLPQGLLGAAEFLQRAGSVTCLQRLFGIGGEIRDFTRESRRHRNCQHHQRCKDRFHLHSLFCWADHRRK